jgi:hypothetical protein
VKITIQSVIAKRGHIFAYKGESLQELIKRASSAIGIEGVELWDGSHNTIVDVELIEANTIYLLATDKDIQANQ